MRKAFDKNFPNDSVLILSEWGCLPFASDLLENNPGCRNKISEVLSFINSPNEIKKIYLVGFWGYLSSGGLTDVSARWRIPNILTINSSSTFIQNAQRVLGQLTQSNKEIILMRDIPILNFDIRNCFKLRKISINNSEPLDCKYDKLNHDLKNKPYEELINILIEKFPTVKIYDPKPIFADQYNYFAKLEGLPLYYDSDHLSILGANYLLKDLVSKTIVLDH